MDQILAFVTDLKTRSEGGEELLYKFIQRQVDTSDQFLRDDLGEVIQAEKAGGILPPPMIHISVPLEDSPMEKTAKSA